MISGIEQALEVLGQKRHITQIQIIEMGLENYQKRLQNINLHPGVGNPHL